MQPLAATQPKPVIVPPKRMTLSSVVRGKLDVPMKLVIYGVDGIGKSTFAAGAPNPIFLGAESGTSQLEVARFPSPKTFADALEAVETLTNDSHEYGTFVLDSADWLEPLVWRHICLANNTESIEKVGGGYGKGFNVAVEQWRIFLDRIEHMSTTKRMHVVLIAHAIVKTFQNPEGDNYDQYILKMHEKSAGVVREWADAVLFAQHEVHTVGERGEKAKGFSTGRRILYTEERAAFRAKNRFGLPQTLPLSWQSFVDALASRDPAAVRQRCAVLLAAVEDAEKRARGEANLAKLGDDLHRLNEFENRLKETVK